VAHPTVADDLVRSVRYVIGTDQASPDSVEEALLGVNVCVACGTEKVAATLRLAKLQYYRCRECGFSWRIDLAAAAP
jgi:DNA-directed RNA polymerase subunit RPC12/RpoP